MAKLFHLQDVAPGQVKILFHLHKTSFAYPVQDLEAQLMESVV